MCAQLLHSRALPIHHQLGKNYLLHSIEMGQAKPPSKPMFFLKPLSSVIRQGQAVRVPPGQAEVHHEVELGVVINGDCTAVSQEAAMSHVAGYVLALDITARAEQMRGYLAASSARCRGVTAHVCWCPLLVNAHAQSIAKKGGKPWSQSKGYDTFCPLRCVAVMRLWRVVCGA